VWRRNKVLGVKFTHLRRAYAPKGGPAGSDPEPPQSDAKAKSLLARHAVAPRSVARRKARTPSSREIWICRAVLTVTAFHLLAGRLRPARGSLGHGAKALAITGALVWPREASAARAIYATVDIVALRARGLF
jgi:hypothetical protein